MGSTIHWVIVICAVFSFIIGESKFRHFHKEELKRSATLFTIGKMENNVHNVKVKHHATLFIFSTKQQCLMSSKSDQLRFPIEIGICPSLPTRNLWRITKDDWFIVFFRVPCNSVLANWTPRFATWLQICKWFLIVIGIYIAVCPSQHDIEVSCLTQKCSHELLLQWMLHHCRCKCVTMAKDGDGSFHQTYSSDAWAKTRLDGWYLSWGLRWNQGLDCAMHRAHHTCIDLGRIQADPTPVHLT